MITRAEILDIKALATKQGREEQGAFIAEGEKLVGEIRNSSHLADQAYICRRRADFREGDGAYLAVENRKFGACSCGVAKEPTRIG